MKGKKQISDVICGHLRFDLRKSVLKEGGNKTMKKYNKAGNRSHFLTFPLSHFLTFSVLAALCLAGVSGAWALGLSLTGDTNWSLQNISPESINESTIEWTVENTGGEAEDITISAAGETSGWTAVDEITDDDQFILKHNARGDYKSVAGGVSLTDNLPDAGEKSFNLEFTAPRLGSVATEDIKVTLTANNQWYSGPVLSDIDTHYGRKNDTQQVIITGTGFEDPATTWLKDGESYIEEANSTTFNDSEHLTASFSLDTADTGIYTIEVENTSTGDKSPSKTDPNAPTDPDVDCFFGVAAPDSNEWTDDPCLITEGTKVGNASLQTLTGTLGTMACRPCQVSGTIGTLTWSSCQILTDPEEGDRIYHRYTNVMISGKAMCADTDANLESDANKFCGCVSCWGGLTQRDITSKASTGQQRQRMIDCSTADGDTHGRVLVTVDCW